jgi:hypothetical protein
MFVEGDQHTTHAAPSNLGGHALFDPIPPRELFRHLTRRVHTATVSGILRRQADGALAIDPVRAAEGLEHELVTADARQRLLNVAAVDLDGLGDDVGEHLVLVFRQRTLGDEPLRI